MAYLSVCLMHGYNLRNRHHDFVFFNKANFLADTGFIRPVFECCIKIVIRPRLFNFVTAIFFALF